MRARHDVVFAEVPKTQLTFCNVPLVPVRNRAGETRYVCATWGGAMYVFDRSGDEKVILYPEGSLGSYSFTPALQDGFAWAVHTGGKMTLIDVDAGEYAFVQDVPLQQINWGADITSDGYLVCEASPGDAMVYDTNRRVVAHMITPISQSNHYAHHIRAAADGCVVLLVTTPGAEIIRLDPKSGEYSVHVPGALRDVTAQIRVPTFLADGRYALPMPDGVRTLTYPDIRDDETIPYPDGTADAWSAFRDHGDGRLYVHRDDGGALHALGDDGTWRIYLERFATEVGIARPVRFAALPDGGLLGLSSFGELVEYSPGASPRIVAELDTYGHQRVCYLEPGEGSRVFTTTFINHSCQELDYRTGKGRNIRPCQKKSGQTAGVAWHGGKLWLAGYGGAEIDVYDPNAGGTWPDNPRHVLDIGHDQMRPVGMRSDGRHLWTVTRARYGKLGGALVRVDPEAETCKVWRNLVPDHNPTGFRLDRKQRRIYVGTSIHADCGSAPPAEGPATVFAFDMEREEVVWVARPVASAEQITVLVEPVEGLLPVLVNVEDAPTLLLLDTATGEEKHWTDPGFQTGSNESWMFLGPDERPYVATADGVYEYDLRTGMGEKRLDGPASRPSVRGRDLFFLRGYEVGVVEGFFGTVNAS